MRSRCFWEVNNKSKNNVAMLLYIQGWVSYSTKGRRSRMKAKRDEVKKIKKAE
ncbi:hypothetical protein PEX1_050050 [Penicillium expansum]|uniref:Uncharacterized protein n=1 Tax=Penicillium expansum TaxID=27334 RepID=A0A0A2KH18_PENEN|nr:hypothetical protein PEX2_103990 [Penicillium expansum]KGO37883.1 hypothetical protein PEXP_078990 [Penicillium expansum]KGO49766.1 hypothetical protein PEX2_103990 [Penicillium expansum]KGO66171.1 hypothetical protein PEX1_050050 [Penicillium expansum]